MNTIKLGAAVLLTGLIAVTGCAAGTKDDEADKVDTNSGDAGDDDKTTTTTAPDTDDSGDTSEEEAPPGALLLVMDASGSMNDLGTDGKPLIDGAKAALHGVVDSLPDGLHTGLRVFGHRYPNTDKENGCKDSELISPVEPLDREALNAAIDSYNAKGFTPIGYSLQQAAKDLPPEGPRTIILVSDGDDTCDAPDPCQVARDLQADGIELVVHTVGFALGDNQAARDQLTCIAEASGGQFYDVADADDLATTLEDVSEDESNRFEAAGQQLEGAEIPRDANTGQLGMQHVDTVTHGDVNYYRFEIPQGSEVEAEVVTQGNPNSDELLCMGAYLTNDDGENYGYSDLGGDNSSITQLDNIDPVVIDDADEVFLKLDASDCRGSGGGNPDVKLQVEFTVTVND